MRKRTAFQANEIKLDKKIFKGKILPFNWPVFPITIFIGIVRNAVKLKQFEWCKKFIAKYGDNLHSREKKFLINYCRALNNFYNPDNNSEESIINFVNNIQNEIHSVFSEIEFLFRLFKIQMLYNSLCHQDIKIGETLTHSVDALAKWLGRDKEITEHKKILFKEILSLFKKLINLKINSYEKRDHIFRNQYDSMKIALDKSHYFYEKDWVISKFKNITVC